MSIDYETMYDFLEKYQIKRPDWEDFRVKIPQSLLDKWQIVLTACRENGFINPVARNGKIVFSQILTHNREAVDGCTVCNNSIINGTCRGRLRYIDNKKTFFFCWGKS